MDVDKYKLNFQNFVKRNKNYKIRFLNSLTYLFISQKNKKSRTFSLTNLIEFFNIQANFEFDACNTQKVVKNAK